MKKIHTVLLLSLLLTAACVHDQNPVATTA